MTESIADRYRRLGAAFATTIEAVPADRWEARSPCEEWTARDVVRHVVDTQGMFAGLVGRTLEAGPGVDDDPLAAWVTARDQLQSDLEDPERAGEEFDGFFGRARFDAAIDRFLVLDLIIHRWDLARATGGDETIGEADLDTAEQTVAALGDALYQQGASAPPLDPPDGADRRTRLLAALGRRAW